jgi:hypothetical protein
MVVGRAVLRDVANVVEDKHDRMEPRCDGVASHIGRVHDWAVKRHSGRKGP